MKRNKLDDEWARNRRNYQTYRHTTIIKRKTQATKAKPSNNYTTYGFATIIKIHTEYHIGNTKCIPPCPSISNSFKLWQIIISLSTASSRYRRIRELSRLSSSRQRDCLAIQRHDSPSPLHSSSQNGNTCIRPSSRARIYVVFAQHYSYNLVFANFCSGKLFAARV